MLSCFLSENSETRLPRDVFNSKKLKLEDLIKVVLLSIRKTKICGNATEEKSRGSHQELIVYAVSNKVAA